MPASLPVALHDLLSNALSGLFGGAKPAVVLTVTETDFVIDPTYAEVSVSDPRPDDRSEDLPFDTAKSSGPYLLTQPPAAGPRRVSLITATQERIALGSDEIVWDTTEPRKFTLVVHATRDVSAVKTVRVQYSIVAVYTRLRGRQTLAVRLQPTDAARLEEALSLVVGVVALNRQALMDASRSDYAGGVYGAHVGIASLQITRADYAPDAVTLLLGAEVELKAERALASDEGLPITHILTSGRTTSGTRPVDIAIDVDI